MRNLKKWVALFLTIMMAISMVACGAPKDGGNSPVPSSGSSSGDSKDKLIIWTNLTAEAQAKVLQKQFSEVANEMGIEIEMVTVSFNDMYTKLATAVESNSIPDIMHTNFAGAAYLHSQDMIVGLDDVIDSVGR